MGRLAIFLWAGLAQVSTLLVPDTDHVLLCTGTVAVSAHAIWGFGMHVLSSTYTAAV